jgi:hypothetical protein
LHDNLFQTGPGARDAVQFMLRGDDSSVQNNALRGATSKILVLDVASQIDSNLSAPSEVGTVYEDAQ